MINMKKIKLLLYGFLIGVSLISCDKQKKVKPNIVFILADDLGYADLSSYGSKFINTQFLDEMALSGAKLTSYYSSQAVCSASRAAILTGAYSNRIGINASFLSSLLYCSSKLDCKDQIFPNTKKRRIEK